MEQTAKRPREYYMDILRIIACYLVIFNHTNERGFYRYFPDGNTPKFVFYMVTSLLCKVGVPLFFMISGANLIGKEESIKKTYSRMIKIVVDLVLFSVFYNFVDHVFVLGETSIVEMIRQILQNPYWHLWYLYAYITFLIALPILRLMAKNLDKKMAYYLVIVIFVYNGILPIIASIFKLILPGQLTGSWLLVNTFMYPILGYIGATLSGEITGKQMRNLLILDLIAITSQVICQYMYFTYDAEATLSNETFLTNFDFLNALTVFLLVKYLVQKRRARGPVSDKWKKILLEISGCTFGIYLFHVFFLWKVPKLFDIWQRIERYRFGMRHYGVFISCAGVFVICLVVVWILRKIPLVKKLF